MKKLGYCKVGYPRDRVITKLGLFSTLMVIKLITSVGYYMRGLVMKLLYSILIMM